MNTCSRLLLVLFGFCLLAEPVAASPSQRAKETDAQFAYALAQGLEVLSLAVAAKPGRTEEAVARIEALGGRVRFRSDSAGYVTAALPVEAYVDFALDASVEAVAIDQPTAEYDFYAGWNALAPPDDASGGEAKPFPDGDPSWPPVPSTRPFDKPYPILKDMDGLEFRKKHPTYDGRGVVIAQVEWFADFLSPELQVALDLDGRPVRKILDVVNTPEFEATLDEAPTPTAFGPDWIKLGDPVAGPGTVKVAGQRYVLPGDGEYRLGEFKMVRDDAGRGAAFAGYFEALSNAFASHEEGERGGAAEDGELVRAVVWSEEENALRIDVNGDRDFTNDPPVANFRQSGAFGVLGHDDPETAERETVGYAVQKEGDFISINFGMSNHATVVASAAAGSAHGEGRIEGIAPGAQLLIVNPGSRTTTYAQAVVSAFADARTDVILVEGYFPSTARHNLKDGRSVIALVLQRLVQRYNKPALFTASNLPGMTSIVDVGNGDDVLSIGAYQSAASVFANRATRTRYPDDLHWSTAEGPAGDGALKPDLLAPANPVTALSRFRPATILARLAGVFELPVGYAIGGGTSTSTPVAAGAAAVLVSAAKQEGVDWNADKVNRALRLSARYMPRFAAFKQGRGVLQIEGAWRRLSAESENDAVDIAIDAPVRTATSEYLPTAHRGRGLFEREGWRLGDKARRTIMLTRTSGPRAPVTYDVQWRGDLHGAFSSRKRITLPLNVPTPFHVRIHATAPGAHSASAQLVHRGREEVVVNIPATIAVPYEFTEDNQFAQKVSLQIDRPGRANVFFRVPDGASSLDVSFNTVRKGLRAYLFQPGKPGPGYMHYVARNEMTASGAKRILFPEPGVWEVMFSEIGDQREYDWSVRNEAHLPPVAVELNMSVSAVDSAFASSGSDRGGVLSFDNRFAAFEGGAEARVGQMRRATGVLNAMAYHQYDIAVEKGASSLIAEVAALDDADLDLYLFDCTDGACYPARYGVNFGASERVYIRNPNAGAWKAVVMRYDAGSAPAQYQFRDVIVHPEFGGAHLADIIGKRSSGEKWTSNAYMLHNKPASPDREPVIVVIVQGAIKTRDQGAATRDALRVSSQVHQIKDPTPLDVTILPTPDGIWN